MELVRLDDAVAFRRFADPLLLENEAANNLALGVSGVAASTTTYEEFHGWIVRRKDRVVAAAVRTPPHNLILAVPIDPLAVQFLADSLGALPGAIGNVPAIDVFVEARPEDAHRTMRQGVFKLSRVIPPEPGPGSPRPASEADRDLVVTWQIAFQEEAVGHVDRGAAEQLVEHRLCGPPNEAGFWLYEVDGVPVALSGHTGSTPHGIRVGPVYTPPAHRRQGYATRLVAEQSQWLLDNGHRFCFLYTDLANPTSNSIYRRIGYSQIAESAQYSFNPSPGR